MLTRISRPLASARQNIIRAAFSTVVESNNQPQADDALLPSSANPPATTSTTQHPKTPEHEIILDIPPAQDPLLHYLASCIMRNGMRKRAEAHVTKMLTHIHAFTRSPPLPIFREAVSRASPSVKVVTHKGSGKNIQIPVALNERQRTQFAVHWILEGCKRKSGRTVGERVAREILGIMRGEAKVLDKKKNLHKLAMVNRGNIRLPPR